MTARIPIIPTIIVGGAIAVMIALGFWQLSRMDQKEALIAQAEQNLRMSSEVEYPRAPGGVDAVLYRRTTIDCLEVLAVSPRAGTSASGAKGWAQRASCTLSGLDSPVDVDIGWSVRPEAAEWAGGEVRGTIAPGGRIVAAEPVAGLELLASPDPRDLPNNHLAYAGQWFFFALTALAIYILALRRRSATKARDD
ncbi:SURF1 family protein [Qipengyuania sp. 1NDW9]|uniref:SURF1 family protein n=1 Tax=Qipengyuania xiapuensis TaxID=2867236 RepID=UPI001C879D25|nr:SURF1 family protein [Qipengyuania xiapuensis]MBX7492559.1 SURF1 family protein [Qipengyuania xiapuensis]